MARENKRTRDERRFGRPERLADALWSMRWGIPREFSEPESLRNGFQERVIRLARDVEKCKVFTADNVLKYYASTYKSHEFDWRHDLPVARPPFGFTFIEMTPDASGIPFYPDGFCIPKRWGFLMIVLDKDGWMPDGSGFVRHTYPFPESTDSIVLAELFEEFMPGSLDIGIGSCMVPLDSGGSIATDPEFCMPRVGVRGPSSDELCDRVKRLAAPAFLALAFMHCKNVVRLEHQPDREINRERRKAGLRPFVRYHTINIEPMRRVLRTEGNVESEGLKRALHICRGHFSTYSEERPLFGRVAGTFWVPSHVRGSAKEGVVISDYNVKGPS